MGAPAGNPGATVPVRPARASEESGGHQPPSSRLHLKGIGVSLARRAARSVYDGDVCEITDRTTEPLFAAIPQEV